MEYLLLGKVIGSFGLDGTLRINSSTYFAKERYQSGNIIYLNNPETNEKTKCTVISFRNNNGIDFVKVNEISVKEHADSLKGYEVLIEKEKATLPKNYYHFSDLKLCNVYDEKHNLLGNVIEVEEFHQVTLRVKKNSAKQTFFVPFIDEFIISVDIEKKEIIIKLIEGMM